MTSSLRTARRLVLPEIDSTNAEAARRLASGEAPPFWVVAEKQTAGRGRAGRSWISRPGNFYATAVVPLASALAEAPQLSFVAGIAVYEAVGEAGGGTRALPLRLKWPNDLLADGKKAGGILIETAAFPPGQAAAIIGVGVNLAHAPESVPQATYLAAHGLGLMPLTLLDFLAASLEGWLAIWERTGFAAVREAWLARAGPLGEEVSVRAGGTVAAGRFAGMDEHGALLLETDAGLCRFTFGDVSLAA